MIRINLKEVIQRIYRDTSRTASLRTTASSKKEEMFYEERVLGGENEDVEHDAAFRGDENIEAVPTDTGRIFEFSLDKRQILDRIRAEANTKAAAMKRPELSIQVGNTLKDEENISFDLSEEDIDGIKKHVEQITDKRASILSKENGKEYADYTLTKERTSDNEKKTVSVAFGSAWNWNAEVRNEILKRARILSVDGNNFFDIAGIESALQNSAKALLITSPTIDSVHKSTSLRARMDASKRDNYEYYIFKDQELLDIYTTEGKAKISALFSQTDEGAITLYIDDSDLDYLENVSTEYLSAYSLSQFYMLIGDSSTSKEYAGKAYELLQVISEFKSNQTGGTFESMLSRWKSDAVSSAVSSLSAYGANMGASDTLFLEGYLDGTDDTRVSDMVQQFVINSILSRFYSAVLKKTESEEYSHKATEKIQEAENILRRQRIYTDDSLFTSLLAVAEGDAGLLFAGLPTTSKTKKIYISAVINRILYRFYTQLGLTDVSALYGEEYNDFKALANNSAAQISASYSMIEGRMRDGISALSDLLAPLQRELPAEPITEESDYIRIQLKQATDRLTYSSVYGIKNLSENYIVCYALSGWIRLCEADNRDEERRREEIEIAIKRAVNRRTRMADYLWQKLEDACRDIHGVLHPYYDLSEYAAGYHFDAEREEVTYAICSPYENRSSVKQFISAYIESSVLEDWYSNLEDPRSETMLKNKQSNLAAALSCSIPLKPRTYTDMI